MTFEKGTAARRGLIGAAAGFIIMFIFIMFSGGFKGGYPLLYLIAGPFYGFGFTFANWKIVMEKTKQGAKQGAAVFGISVILSHLFRDNRWGIWGWVYFLLRVSWHLGMCWIPGIFYGIKMISAELKEKQTSPAAPVSDQTKQRIAALKANMKTSAALVTQAVKTPSTVKPVSNPTLSCVSGVFSGASFPLTPNEEVFIGSDPSVCQIVLPEEYASPIHCSFIFDRNGGGWQVRDLSGGLTLANGISPVTTGKFQTVSSGTILCVGKGSNSQRFRLG